MPLGRFLAIDPGEDTGWSIWNGDDLIDGGTDKMWTFSDMLWSGVFDGHPEPSTEPIEEPTTFDDLYLAGLLDGEAYIGVIERTNKRPSATISVGMCTPEPLNWAAARYGGNVQGPQKTTHQDQYRWYISAQAEVYYILSRVYPYLKVKKQNAMNVFLHLEKHTRFGKKTEPLTRIVCEDWALYPWLLRTGAMDWDSCRTPRLIGSITSYCRFREITLDLQPAKIKERAEAAGAEAFFEHPLHENRHRNDSVRHGIFRNAKERGAPWTNLASKEFDGP